MLCVVMCTIDFEIIFVLLCFFVFFQEEDGIRVFFFFKQKTAYEIYQCDWSSDVCSSDLRSREAYLVALCKFVLICAFLWLIFPGLFYPLSLRQSAWGRLTAESIGLPQVRDRKSVV